MKYLLLILVLAPGVFSIVKEHKKQGRNSLTSIGYILLSITIIGTIVSAIVEYSSSEDSNRKEALLNRNVDSLINVNSVLREDIKTLKDTMGKENKTLRADVRNIQDSLNPRIAALTKDNYDLSRELTKNSIETNRNILGDGYTIFGLGGRPQANNYYGFLEATSQYSMYDTRGVITDFSKAINCMSNSSNNKFIIDHDCFYNNSVELKNINYIGPHQAAFIDYSFQTTDKYKKLEIKLGNRTINTLQQSIIKLQVGLCPQSYKVYQILPSGKFKLLKEKNDLLISDEEWKKTFFPLENRTIGIFLMDSTKKQ